MGYISSPSRHRQSSLHVHAFNSTVLASPVPRPLPPSLSSMLFSSSRPRDDTCLRPNPHYRCAPSAILIRHMAFLRATDEDVVEGNVDKLNDVADGTHDCLREVSKLAAGQRARACAEVERTQETDTNSLRDLEEFLAVGCIPLVSAASRNKIGGQSLTLLRLADELDALAEELARHVEDLLQLVGHCEGGLWGVAVDGDAMRVTRAIRAERRVFDGDAKRSVVVEWVRRVVVSWEILVTMRADPYQMPPRLKN